MKFKIRYADKVVGFFSLLALAGVILLVFFVSAKQNWFAKKNFYYTIFDSGSGVTVGMDLTYKGFSVGKVQKINLEGKMVRVDYYILAEYADYVHEGSLVELIISPIGLGSTFVFHPGRGEGLMESGREIYRSNSYFGRKIIDEKLNIIWNTTDSVGVLMSKVSTLVDNLNRITYSLGNAFEGKGKAPVTQLVLSINEILKNLSELTEGLSNTDGAIPKLLGEKFTADISGILSNLDALTVNLAEISGDAEPKIDSALTELNTTIIELNDVLKGLKGNALIRGGVPDRSHEASATVPLRQSDF
ncbi:MAG: MCE family protein [Treponema sp.]|nr:MCE family protein [Treponema sp.]